MNRLLQAWEQLLREAASADFDEREYAVFRIGLVLERHSQPNEDAPALYEEHLSRELLRLTLDEQRQRDAAAFLAAMARKHPGRADAFLYAISRAQPTYAIGPLLDCIRAAGPAWNHRAAYQAVATLETLLKRGGEAVHPALRANDPSDVLADWAQAADEALADRADHVLDRVEAVVSP